MITNPAPGERSPERWWQRAFDLVLPPRCVGCGRRGFEVCPTCLEGLYPLGPALCPRCSLPTPGGKACPSCLRRPPILRAILAHYPFDGLMRAAIVAVKYRGRTRLIPFLTGSLLGALEKRPLSVDVLVPVPLGAGRLRSRGFNQSELLARELASVLSVPLGAPDTLIRLRDTAQQTGLAARDRRRNVADAFAVADAAPVRGKRVLLVDDVCTTGATLDACAEVLTSAGAAGIWAVVVARELFSGGVGAGSLPEPNPRERRP